jgi:hypothetical protein
VSGLLFATVLLGAPGGEGLERRLVRTIQLGVADAEPAEILAYAKSSATDFVGHCLARAALVVLGHDEGFPEWPLDRLLDRQMSLLSGGTDGNAFPARAGLPEGFAGDDLAFALVYALAVTGQADQVVEVLDRRLDSDDEWVRGVALQGLRNLGLPRADASIERANRAGRDRNLPESLLADLHYPFLADLASRLRLIPPAERTREALLEMASSPCGEKAALAVYLMGFLPDAEAGASPEVARLRELARADCFYTRYFAVRSLALRSRETLGFWLDLLRDTNDNWQRQQIVRAATFSLGPEFTERSLELLAAEPGQYVQWELMQGFLETRQGARFRDYWDLWQPTTLVYRLYFREGGGSLPEADRDRLLRWLETGARPRDDWVRNHLLYRLAGEVAGPDTRRYLRAFAGLSDLGGQWWILSGLRDAGALPLLRYWLTLPSEESQHTQLEHLVERLEGDAAGGGTPGEPPCCAPTADCLLATVRAEGGGPHAVILGNQAEARAWLEQARPSADVQPELNFVGPLAREALVRIGGRVERYEHLYGCWHRIPPGGATVTQP